MLTDYLYKQLGLSDFEYNEIKKRLNRTPNMLETYLFSAMWSEHCGYKHSKNYLKLFPNDNAVLNEENSGGIEIGNHVIFFKMESHNHPSAIDPYQGAATGVGGIIRDILTLNARPVAILDSLKFGQLNEGKNKYLLEGIVKGISDYGNSIGVPTIGGETSFDECFSGLPLVNVMAVGIAKKNKIVKSIAKSGGIVVLLGSLTGRDGIHGASFASKELKSHSGHIKKENRLSIQTADPFMKKKVIEASLEIFKSDGIISAQDCGAAGILSASSEMAFKGNCGMELFLDKVLVREENMQPWEIMLSESQERMIFIVKEQYLNHIFDIAAKFEVNICAIGRTIPEKEYRLFWNNEIIANIAPEVLNNCITYNLNNKEPDYIKEYASKTCQDTEFKEQDIIEILKCPDIASKKYIYSQYDYMVGNRTVSKPENTSSNALWIKEEKCFCGFTADSDYRKTYLNPFEGSRNTVYEAFRNLISCGFRPKGITNCLNFANPEKDECAFQFIESVKGISQACKELKIPVVSGNVSFYNENSTHNPVPPAFFVPSKILPVPVIGMAGISYKNILKNNLKENYFIYLAGRDITCDSDTGGALYQKLFYNFLGGKIDIVDTNLELQLADFILNMYSENKISACNDVSKGGVFVSLFELLHTAHLGFKGNLINIENARKSLFGEVTGRYIVCSKRSLESDFKKYNLPFRFL
ncbi:MAG: phosphoribosylformylglycinamidine synthase subunit PurL [Candidatus Gastranaerophilales bacterium]|nr:phosphoribosylformylglycinamidine synthase subunit PurL [Candidatus Gastranaerophilales bacterium]